MLASSSSALIGAAVGGGVGVDFVTGQICEIFQKDVLQAVRVDELDVGNNTCKVTFLASGKQASTQIEANAETLLSAGLRPLRHVHTLTAQSFPVGLKCRARYSTDGLWYDAVIEQHTPLGCKVKYDGYNEIEQVPLQYIKLRPKAPVVVVAAADAVPAAVATELFEGADVTTATESNSPVSNVAAAAAASSSASSAIEPVVAVSKDGFVVPEGLVVRETDSDGVKARKKKTVKGLKRQHKEAVIGEVHVQKQQGWKAFQLKSKKKGLVKGSMARPNRESMFSTTNISSSSTSRSSKKPKLR